MVKLSNRDHWKYLKRFFRLGCHKFKKKVLFFAVKNHLTINTSEEYKEYFITHANRVTLNKTWFKFIKLLTHWKLILPYILKFYYFFIIFFYFLAFCRRKMNKLSKFISFIKHIFNTKLFNNRTKCNNSRDIHANSNIIQTIAEITEKCVRNKECYYIRWIMQFMVRDWSKWEIERVRLLLKPL